MKIEIEKRALDSLLKVYCQFLVEEGQHNNLRDEEKRAIAHVTHVAKEHVNGDLILSLCGYN